MDLKRWFQGKSEYLQFIPLVLCFFLENKIYRHYYFGLLQKLMAHSLTAALIVYTGLLVHNRTNKWEHPDLKQESVELASMLGFLIYAGAGASMLVTTVWVKFWQGKTWDNVAVRCGLILAKVAMLIDPTSGPLIYFCLVLQIYNFALIVNKRYDSKPGVTLPIQIMFAVLTMQMYFLRSSHRERFSTVRIARVCPGETNCEDHLHNALLVADFAYPYLIGHLCLPLIVKARVQYTYAR